MTGEAGLAVMLKGTRTMEHPPEDDLESAVTLLERELGADWPHLQACRERAVAKRAELKEALAGKDSDDTSIVVFVSLARDGFTRASDIYWTLLVDGFVDTQHANVVREIRQI